MEIAFAATTASVVVWPRRWIRPQFVFESRTQSFYVQIEMSISVNLNLHVRLYAIKSIRVTDGMVHF